MARTRRSKKSASFSRKHPRNKDGTFKRKARAKKSSARRRSRH